MIFPYPISVSDFLRQIIIDKLKMPIVSQCGKDKNIRKVRQNIKCRAGKQGDKAHIAGK
jgi:hypothetical protein